MKTRLLYLLILFLSLQIDNMFAQYINLIPIKYNSFKPNGNGIEKTDDIDNQTNFSFPLGANAGNPTGGNSGNAGPVLGFQVWERDQYFMNVLFSYEGGPNITKEFGNYLLNPTKQGTALSFSGSHSIGILGSWGILNYSGRASISFPNWDATINNVEMNYSGLLIALNVGIQITTNTMAFNNGNNEYQIGFEISPGIRLIGGNLAGSSAEPFLISSSVLGINKTFFGGGEFTFFARLNSIQPYVRLSYYDASGIEGFDHLQGYIGISVLSSVFQSKF